MTDNFERCVSFVLRHEGGYVNDPRDPGGETKYGISKRAYPMLNIKDLSIEDAKMIYRKDYWDSAKCGTLEWPMCLVHFDSCVNLGVGKATTLKTKAFNWTDYLFLRIAHYSNLAGSRLSAQAYLRGWVNRVLDLWKEAKNGLV